MSEIFTLIKDSQILSASNQKINIRNLQNNIELKLPSIVPNSFYFEFLISNPLGFNVILKTINSKINGEDYINLLDYAKMEDGVYDVKLTVIFEEESNNWRIY